MARQPLGALTTVNTSTHLDAMFIELYAAAGGDFTQIAGMSLGAGSGIRTFTINGGSPVAQGGAVTFSRAGAPSFSVGDAGGVLSGASDTSDAILYSYGSNNFRIYTGGAERFRMNSTGRLGLNGSPSATNQLKVYGSIELDVTGSSMYSNNFGVVSSAAVMSFDAGASNAIVFKRGATETGRFDSVGNFISRPTAAGPTLATNGEMSFRLVSNTSLQVIVRGSDGVTRAATLTLS